MKQYENLPFRCEDILLVRLKKIKKRKIDVRALARIRASIEEVGLLEPLHVYPEKDGDYGILDGESRYDILLEMGRETAPCFVFDVMDIYTANHQVNHLTPVEEARMIKKAMEVIDGKVIAKVFGLKTIDGRLNEALLKRLHPMVVKAFNSKQITKACAHELAEVTPERQLEIFATMQNTKNFGPNFVKKQILLTPFEKQQSKRKRTPWAENKEREKSLGTKMKETKDERDHLASLFREYTAALMMTVIHAREIVTKKPMEKYLKEHFAQIFAEIKDIIASELIEEKKAR